MTKFLLRDSSGPTCGGESSGGEKELEYEDSAKRLFERNEWIIIIFADIEGRLRLFASIP